MHHRLFFDNLLVIEELQVVDHLLNKLQWCVEVKQVKEIQLNVQREIWSVRVKLNCLEASLICGFFDFDFRRLKNCRWWIRISQSYCLNISPRKMSLLDKIPIERIHTNISTNELASSHKTLSIWNDLEKVRSDISHCLRVFQRYYDFEELQVMEDSDPSLHTSCLDCSYQSIRFKQSAIIIISLSAMFQKPSQVIGSNECKQQSSNRYV